MAWPERPGGRPNTDGQRPPRIFDFSEQALQQRLAGFDPAMAALARRFDRSAAPRLVSAGQVSPPPPFASDDLAPLTPAEAVRANAAVPVDNRFNRPAAPFTLGVMSAQEADRALDCLTAAVYYESAYETPAGQAAVAQVVLNRVRHPAFPKTVCAVVLQGSERSTGCQFTFTCDGALIRHGWRPEQWARARTQAALSLGGQVYAPVGYATHYHTDWVVPYWQSSLDKVAAVHSHLFFRWSGWWGTPPAFNRTVSSDEPAIRALALYSDAHKTGAALVAAQATAAEVTVAALAPEALPVPLASDSETFLITIDPHLPPESFALLATRACGERPRCKLMAWTDRARTPTAMPLDAGQIDAMAFSYMRDRTFHYDKTLWNCATFKRPDPSECMKTQVLLPPRDAAPKAAATPAAPAGEILPGVRRKPGATTPTALATPVKPDSPLTAESR